MGRNTSRLYYPAKESVASILSVVDEFVVALGKSDDDTQAQLESLQSDKVKIIHTTWDTDRFPHGAEYARQTDIAKAACSGDWLFYLQSDEVVHERFLPAIVAACERYLDDREVDGFLFGYKHFYGDYDHYNDGHGWYPHEIRIVRNNPEIHSFMDAQSFRRIPNFDGVSYRRKEGTEKLRVVKVDAEIYHYGWVRPPRLMQQKKKTFAGIYRGQASAEAEYQHRSEDFDYGNIGGLPRFEGTHPAVMADFVRRFDWASQINYDPRYRPSRELMKHETPRGRLITWARKHLFGGTLPVGYSNWELLKR
jgi:hypothetical protein